MSATSAPPVQHLRHETLARACLLVLALIALTGVALSLRNGWLTDSTLLEDAGFTKTFRRGWEHLANQPAFFTFMSNLIVGVTSLSLALTPRARSGIFHAVHLSGIVCIVITGVVFNVLLRSEDPMAWLPRVHDTLQHVVTPILAPLVWLVFGPIGQVTWRRIGLASVIPLGWLGVTLIRGVIIDWYPYSILDVPRLGYGGIAVYVVAILGFFLIVAALMWVVDRVRARGLIQGR